MAELKEVAGGEPGSETLIDADDRNFPLIGRFRGDNRCATTKVAERTRHGSKGRDHHNSVDHAVTEGEDGRA